MVGKKIIGYVAVGTLTTGLVASVLNSENMENLKEALEVTKTNITQYESNEQHLVNTYNEIKTNAEAEIAKANSKIEEKNTQIVKLSDQIKEKNKQITELEEQLSDNNGNITELTEQIKNLNTQVDELTAEVEKLTAEVNELTAKVEKLTAEVNELTDQNKGIEYELDKANQEVDKANQYIEATLNTVEEINGAATPLTAEELETITGELDSSIINPSVKNLKLYIDQTYYEVSFELTEEMNIAALSSKANITIKLTHEDGQTTEKDKTWAGYLNDVSGNKYGKGFNIPANKYSNDLTPGLYFTSGRLKENQKKIVKAELIVKNNNGDTTTLTITK